VGYSPTEHSLPFLDIPIVPLLLDYRSAIAFLLLKSNLENRELVNREQEKISALCIVFSAWNSIENYIKKAKNSLENRE